MDLTTNKKETLLKGEKIADSLKNATFKYVFPSLVGLKLGEFVITKSAVIDAFFFKGIPLFLQKESFVFMNAILFPNWFSVIVLLGLVIGTWAEVKIVQNRMFEEERSR